MPAGACFGAAPEAAAAGAPASGLAAAALEAALFFAAGPATARFEAAGLAGDVDFDAAQDTVTIDMVPKGSGSENNSFLRMAIPAEGLAAVKRFVIDCVIDAGGKTCPPTIVGVGVGGTSDLCVHLAKRAATRPLGSVCDDPLGAELERELSTAASRARRRNPAAAGNCRRHP